VPTEVEYLERKNDDGVWINQVKKW